MATVRSPSSLAALKMRIAISLRLAASNLRIGLVVFMPVASLLLLSFFLLQKEAFAKFYIVSRTQREEAQFFRFTEHKFQIERSASAFAPAVPLEERI